MYAMNLWHLQRGQKNQKGPKGVVSRLGKDGSFEKHVSQPDILFTAILREAGI